MKRSLPILGLLLFCIPAHSQTLVHKYQGASCTNLTTCNLAVTAVGAGNTLIIFVSSRPVGLSGGACSSGVSDNGSPASTYANVKLVQYDTVNNIFGSTCYAKNVTGAPTQITITLSGQATSYGEIAIFEVSGLDTTAPLDKNVEAEPSGCPGACTTSASPSSGASGTTSFTNEYLVCGIFESSNSSTLSAATGGFAIQQQLTNPGHMGQLDQTVSATGSYTCGATLSVAAEWSTQLSTWKSASQPASGGGGFGGRGGMGGKGGFGFMKRKHGH